jgi:hypothetical protein
MKQLYGVFALIILGTSCQHQVPSRQAVITKPVLLGATNKASSHKKLLSPVQTTIPDSLTPAMLAMLHQVDLSELYLSPEPRPAGGYQSALDGFFGTNPQRLSLALIKITRDSMRPGLFHVIGKSRFKKQISNFDGVLQITSLADYYDQGSLLTQGEDTFIQDTTERGQGDIINAKAYSAAATFRFQSTSLPATYALTGRALLDFWVTDKGKIGRLYSPCEGCVDNKSPSKGSSLLLQGNWLDSSANKPKAFSVSRDVFFISGSLIEDFGIGDRGAQVNPKYAKLGWNTYWENDEWWADTPKPSLNM